MTTESQASAPTIVDLPFTRADIEQTIPARFEAVADRFADHVALTGGGREWTYRDLNKQANRVAHAILAALGGGSGAVVYVVPQSPEMVIATLGILKAGKTYLAVHPGMPLAAQANIVRDVLPDLIVTTRALASRATDLAAGARPVLVMDDIGEGHADANPPGTAAPHDASTIFYTSGTTGEPKGVVKSHRAVLHRVWLAASYDAVSPADRQSLLTHCAFSASESDMFGALLLGATLCTFDLASEGLTSFCAWIARERVTLLHPPVLFLRRFLSSLDPQTSFPSVRIVALAGDVVLASDLQAWRRHFSPSCVVFHRFSITETALLTLAQIGHEAAGGAGVVEAGLPVIDKTLEVIDDGGRPVAPGDTGELVVKSEFLATGYWRQPQETAAVFADDPDVPGRRMYRTGDLGRFLEDGRFEFLGRRDHQIKIRGYRVDTRQVEAAIAAINGVAEVAVVPTREQDEQHVHAFVVWKPGARRSSPDVGAELRAILPQWAVPTTIRSIPSLPVTLTGKVDRRRLDEDRRASVDAWPAEPEEALADEEPADDLERAVAAVCARVLRLPSVGRHANFFDLGGNSLLVAELQLELESAIGRWLPLADLLQHASVEGIAGLMRREPAAPAAASSVESLLVPLRAHGLRRPLFFVHGGRGRAVAGRRFLDALGEDQPMLGFQAKGLDSDELPHRSVSEMAATYVSLMRERQPKGPYFIGAACAGGVVAIEMARALRQAGEDVAPLLLIDPAAPPREQPWAQFLGKFGAVSLAAIVARAPAGPRLLKWVLGASRFQRRGQVRVWADFRFAAYMYRPAAYDGPVEVIGSRARVKEFAAGRWKGSLTGPVHCVETGQRHDEALDSSNEETAAHLRRCAEAAHAWCEARERTPGVSGHRVS